MVRSLKLIEYSSGGGWSKCIFIVVLTTLLTEYQPCYFNIGANILSFSCRNCVEFTTTNQLHIAFRILLILAILFNSTNARLPSAFLYAVFYELSQLNCGFVIEFLANHLVSRLFNLTNARLPSENQFIHGWNLKY